MLLISDNYFVIVFMLGVVAAFLILVSRSGVSDGRTRGARVDRFIIDAYISEYIVAVGGCFEPKISDALSGGF